MRSHIEAAHMLFVSGCQRAENLSAIHNLLKNTAPAALDCDDILRSALVLVVSSFDLYIHDVFRTEVLYKLRVGNNIASFRVPFDVLHMDASKRAIRVEEEIRKDNAHKSFVAPDKLGECLRIIVHSPWDAIAVQLSENVAACKSKLKSVVALRNRIAHEADVNPELGGVELWPIYAEDVERSVSFLRRLGLAIAKVIDGS